MKTPKARLLPSGSWFCRVRVGGEDIGVTAPTEKQAVAEAMAIKAGLKQPPPDAKQITLSNAIDAYITAREGVLSPSTIRGYRTIHKHRFLQLQQRKLSTITQQQWQSAVSAEARAVSPKTVKDAVALCASALRDAGYQMPTVRLPAASRNEHAFLSPEQIPIFLAAAEGDTLELEMLLGLHGLRRSEILALHWSDLRDGKIYVHAAAVYGADNKIHQKSVTKNRSSTREVPIVIDRLALLISDRRGDPDELVASCSADAMWRHVNRVCKSCGLPEVGTHGLRHSFASLCYRLRLPELVAMQLGGWSNYGTMRRIYTHIAQRDITDGVDNLRNFFSGQKNGNENGNED